MEILNGQSADIMVENINQLKALFPEAFTKGQVNFDVLKQLLGGAVDEREEKYGLNWHGKKASTADSAYSLCRNSASLSG